MKIKMLFMIIIVNIFLYGCNNDNSLKINSSDYFEDACGCKIKWKEKLKNSKLKISYEVNYDPSNNYEEESFEAWQDFKVDHFLKSVGGKKIKYGMNNPRFEFKIYGGKSFHHDFLSLDDSGYGRSLFASDNFEWDYNQDTITLFRKGLDQNFNIGYLVKKQNKAIFIESEENKIERGISDDKLPSKVLDFCACKCEYMKKGYSEITANEYCKDYFVSESSIYKPWGNSKEILEY